MNISGVFVLLSIVLKLCALLLLMMMMMMICCCSDADECVDDTIHKTCDDDPLGLAVCVDVKYSYFCKYASVEV